MRPQLFTIHCWYYGLYVHCQYLPPNCLNEGVQRRVCECFLCCCSILWVTKSDLDSHSCSITSSSLRSTVRNSLLFLRLIRCVETVAFVAVGGNASVFEAIVHLKWKETLFFCCLMLRRPQASGPVSAAWMDLMNGLSWFSVCGPPWPCGTSLCPQSTVYHLVLLLLWLLCGFDRKKIPWKCPVLEKEQLQFLEERLGF